MVTARRLAADDTRRRLFAAAVALFAEAGYHGATIDAIAKRAGVAKGTFFTHFATKDAVIVDLVARQTRAARAARTAALPAGPLAAMRATVLALGEHAGLSRELSRACLTATLDNPAVAEDTDALFGVVLTDLVADAHAARPLLARGVDPETLARHLMAAYLGAAFHFSASRSSASLAELLVPLVTNIIDANSRQEPRHATSPRRRAVRRR